MHPGVKQDGSVNGGTWPICEQNNSACSEQTEIKVTICISNLYYSRLYAKIRKLSDFIVTDKDLSRSQKSYPQGRLYRHLNKLTRMIAVEIVANTHTPYMAISAGYTASNFSASCIAQRRAWVACCLIAGISTIPIIIITRSKTFCITLILLTLSPSKFLTLCHCHRGIHPSTIVKFRLCHW